MANGAFFDEDYYDSLLAEIREIVICKFILYLEMLRKRAQIPSYIGRKLFEKLI